MMFRPAAAGLYPPVRVAGLLLGYASTSAPPFVERIDFPFSARR